MSWTYPANGPGPDPGPCFQWYLWHVSPCPMSCVHTKRATQGHEPGPFFFSPGTENGNGHLADPIAQICQMPTNRSNPKSTFFFFSYIRPICPADKQTGQDRHIDKTLTQQRYLTVVSHHTYRMPIATTLTLVLFLLNNHLSPFFLCFLGLPSFCPLVSFSLPFNRLLLLFLLFIPPLHARTRLPRAIFFGMVL